MFFVLLGTIVGLVLKITRAVISATLRNTSEDNRYSATCGVSTVSAVMGEGCSVRCCLGLAVCKYNCICVFVNVFKRFFDFYVFKYLLVYWNTLNGENWKVDITLTAWQKVWLLPTVSWCSSIMSFIIYRPQFVLLVVTFVYTYSVNISVHLWIYLWMYLNTTDEFSVKFLNI